MLYLVNKKTVVEVVMRSKRDERARVAKETRRLSRAMRSSMTDGKNGRMMDTRRGRGIDGDFVEGRDD